jgi:hypothetical protein
MGFLPITRFTLWAVVTPMSDSPFSAT